MTKKYCDRCGELIEAGYYNFRIEPTSNLNEYGWFELCPRCKYRFQEYFMKMKEIPRTYNPVTMQYE